MSIRNTIEEWMAARRWICFNVEENTFILFVRPYRAGVCDVCCVEIMEDRLRPTVQQNNELTKMTAQGMVTFWASSTENFIQNYNIHFS